MKCVKYHDGYRFEKNGWIYVHMEGEPYTRGVQHGYLLAFEIEEIIRCLKFLTYWNMGKTWSFFVNEAAQQFLHKLDKELLDEIKGIAEGAREAGVEVTWQEILTWNGYSELVYYWWPFQKTGKTNGAVGRCSAFIATGSATKDGRIILAHNTWESFETGQYLNVIMDINPAAGNRILMQTAPGYICSFSDFIVTASGLVIADTSISGFHVYDPKGTPQFFRIRKASQYAETMNEFAEIMKERSNGGYTSMWLLGNVKTNEIMRFEQGYEYTNVMRTDDGYFIGFNAPEDPRIRNLECADSAYFDIRDHQGARRVRLTQLIEKFYGIIDVDIAKRILSDHYDVYLNKVYPSSRTVDGHYELDDQRYPSIGAPALPFAPQGALDGKVVNSSMACMLSFWGRWGNSSGLPFDVKHYLKRHPQWSYLKDCLHDRLCQPWTIVGIEPSDK